jgi:hypothetical protein
VLTLLKTGYKSFVGDLTGAELEVLTRIARKMTLVSEEYNRDKSVYEYRTEEKQSNLFELIQVVDGTEVLPAIVAAPDQPE